MREESRLDKKYNAKHYLSIIIVFLLASVSSLILATEIFQETSIPEETVRGELAQKIDLYLKRITPFGFSGALLVAKDGHVILNKGYGWAIRSSHIPNTSETVFSTGSLTKQFTAAGIMKLKMMGKLKTEDSLTKFFKDIPPDKGQITLHHLLTHTAGVINYTGLDYEKARREETVKKILEAPLLFKPGQRFHYSNAGYSLLAAVIEKVSGQSYEQFLHQNLFQPASMKFTGYIIPDWSKKVVAHWYVGDKDNGTPLEKAYPYWNLLGNGGILTTTADMYRWHLALLGHKVLSEQAKKKIFTPYLNNYGYGWDVLKTDHGLLIQHDGGSMLGNSAEMRRYLEAKIVTILFCNQSFDHKALFEVVRDKIETLVFGGEVSIPPKVNLLTPKELAKFEGEYKFKRGGHLRIRAADGQLLVTPENQAAVTALYFSEKTNQNYLKEISALSLSAFRAALENNYTPLAEVLYNRDKRLAAVRALVGQRLAEFRKREGEIRDILVEEVLPSNFRGKETTVVYLKLKGKRRNLYFELYWQGKKNVGIGPSPGAPNLKLPFMSVGNNEFAGYQIEMAFNLFIKFNFDRNGSVSGLTVIKKKGRLSASKL